MVALGVFALVGDAHAVSTLVGKLGGILPAQARSLLKGSSTTLVHHRGTGVSVLAVGGVLALWSLTGAMQNVIWGLNIA